MQLGYNDMNIKFKKNAHFQRLLHGVSTACIVSMPHMEKMRSTKAWLAGVEIIFLFRQRSELGIIKSFFFLAKMLRRRWQVYELFLSSIKQAAGLFVHLALM
jgi:hypothetical protein